MKYICIYIWSFLATWNLSRHCQLRLNNACRTSLLWKSYQVDGSNPFGKVTVGFAESHHQKTGPCVRFPQQKPKRGYWMILYTCLWVASRMCPSWMFLSVSFHVDHVKFWILEVFLALGMFGREFGSILPGVISSITNPNNNYTLLFARETAENSYIPLVAPWVIESKWINLTTFKSLEFLKFTENNLFKNGETECRDLETHSLPLWDWANASASVVQVLVFF